MGSVNTQTGRAITVWRISGTRKTAGLRLMERIIARLWASKTRSATGEVVGLEAWSDLESLRASLVAQDYFLRTGKHLHEHAREQQ